MSHVTKPTDDMHREIYRVRDKMLEAVMNERNYSATAQAALLIWAGLLKIADPTVTKDQMMKVAAGVIDVYFTERSN